MVKPTYENLDLDLWVHREKLGRAPWTLCLFHDANHSGSPLLDALHELTKQAVPAQRTLTFVRRSRDGHVSHLRLMTAAQREDLKVMSIQKTADRASIEMTDEGLQLLIDACTAWLGGAEDFGVSPHHSHVKTKDFGALDHASGELWFWGPTYAGP